MLDAQEHAAVAAFFCNGCHCMLRIGSEFFKSSKLQLIAIDLMRSTCDACGTTFARLAGLIRHQTNSCKGEHHAANEDLNSDGEDDEGITSLSTATSDLRDCNANNDLGDLVGTSTSSVTIISSTVSSTISSGKCRCLRFQYI